MSDLEGVMLSDYLLLECINKGGVADLYRAQQSGENSYEVAVKVFRRGYAQRDSFRDHFMAEAEKIGQFDHPNILPFLEYGEGEGLLYMVTPYVTTGTLEDLLQRVGNRLSPLQALPIMQQLCSAIQYAHDRDVIHGNIKPSNVFVASDGRMLLSDFGILRGFDDSQQSLTRVGWGSAEYAAPEQSLGVLRRGSDIYSLGVILFHLLTGSTPFTGQTPVEVLLKHVRQQAPSARSLVPELSEVVDSVLRVALQKRSDDRFASAQELASALQAAVTVAPGASPASRLFAGGAPAFLPEQTTTPRNPLTPLPDMNSSVFSGQRQTPMPLASTAVEVVQRPETVIEQVQDDVPQEAFPQTSWSVAPALPLEKTELFIEPPVLSEHEESSSLPVGEPVEWSPLAQSTTMQDEHAVPLSASEYLQSKPLVSGDHPVITNLPPTPPKEADAAQKSKKPFKKWVPIVIIAALLLGLLGAVFSVFVLPDDTPDDTPASVTSVGPGASTSTATTPKASPTHGPASTATVTRATPTASTAGATATVEPTVGVLNPTPTAPAQVSFTCATGSLVLDGSANFQSATRQMTSAYGSQCSGSNFTLNANGSRSALDCVANSNCDLAYSDLVSSGRPGLVDHPVAALTFAVIISGDIGVTNLTAAQLRGIYTGSITNWSQVGGPKRTITIVTRPSDSAIRTVFENYVLKGGTQTVSGTELWSDSSSAVVQKVGSLHSGISYVPLYYASGAGIQTVSIDGAAPGLSAVANGSYSFWTIEHLYSNGASAGLAQSFITFFSTERGASELANYGAVSIRNMSSDALSMHGTGPGV